MAAELLDLLDWVARDEAGMAVVVCGGMLLLGLYAALGGPIPPDVRHLLTGVGPDDQEGP